MRSSRESPLGHRPDPLRARLRRRRGTAASSAPQRHETKADPSLPFVASAPQGMRSGGLLTSRHLERTDLGRVARRVFLEVVTDIPYGAVVVGIEGGGGVV